MSTASAGSVLDEIPTLPTATGSPKKGAGSIVNIPVTMGALCALLVFIGSTTF